MSDRVSYVIGEIKVYYTQYIVLIWLYNIQGDTTSIIPLFFLDNLAV